MSDATIPMAADVTPTQVALKEPFDTVYHREFGAMVRLAVALVDRVEEAEEVVQEAFAQLYLRYRVVTNPVGYLRVSVLNGCRKVLRRRAVARRWRPDPGDTAGLNTLHGTVADVQYMGAHVEYAVDVNGVELTAWSPDEYEKGAAVLVTFSPEHVHLLPPQG